MGLAHWSFHHVVLVYRRLIQVHATPHTVIRIHSAKSLPKPTRTPLMMTISDPWTSDTTRQLAPSTKPRFCKWVIWLLSNFDPAPLAPSDPRFSAQRLNSYASPYNNGYQSRAKRKRHLPSNENLSHNEDYTIRLCPFQENKKDSRSNLTLNQSKKLSLIA